MIGRPQRAFEYYRNIAPAYREEKSELHRMEPYVYAQMIAGKGSKRHGEAKNSWLTGTAAWNFVALSQWIIGIRPEFDGLRVEPRLPEHVKTARIQRFFRGAHYEISVENRKNDGAIAIEVDGRPIVGTVLPLIPAGSRASVKVILG